MKKFLIKGLILIIILSLPQLGVSMSYFSDTATVSGNIFTASSLEVGMRSGQGNFVSNPLDIELGDAVARDIYTQKLGNLDFKYRSEYEYVSGDTELCNALQLRVWYNWYDALPAFPGDHSTRHMDLKYNGSLSSFDNFDTSEPIHDSDMQLLNSKTYYDNVFYADNEHWFYYQLILPSDASPALRNKTCTFNICTTGWQTNFDDETMGFSDTGIIESTVSTASWANASDVVINEVYYDVASDKGNEGDTSNPDEWIELYNNNSDNPINLKDWTISDNSGSETISHANKYIPAKGYAVIAKSANTWTYWSIPTGVTKIQLGQKIGDGLDDDGDRVVLKDSVGTEIDAVSWGSDIYAFSPSVADVAEGHSISRITKGVDTDVAGDWMDTHNTSSPAGPNPGTNPHASLQTNLDFYVSPDKHSVGFKIAGGGVKLFDQVDYIITYETEGVTQAIVGLVEINGTEEVEANNLLLGTCSSGGACVYHQTEKVNIEVILKGAFERRLTSQLEF